MKELNSVNVKLSNSQPNKLKPPNKKCYWSNSQAIIKYDGTIKILMMRLIPHINYY